MTDEEIVKFAHDQIRNAEGLYQHASLVAEDKLMAARVKGRVDAWRELLAHLEAPMKRRKTIEKAAVVLANSAGNVASVALYVRYAEALYEEGMLVEGKE